jgi:mannose-6-phosphate isomerase-like protein (cupin superfamily)
MLIKKFQECEEFIAGDESILRELLHPDKADLKIGYSLAHAKVRPGQLTKKHRLKGASEVYYIINGKGIMEINGEREDVYPGCAIYIPPEAEQSIQNSGDEDLDFICLVDPAWRPVCEEILEK